MLQFLGLFREIIILVRYIHILFRLIYIGLNETNKLDAKNSHF